MNDYLKDSESSEDNYYTKPVYVKHIQNKIKRSGHKPIKNNPERRHIYKRYDLKNTKKRISDPVYRNNSPILVTDLNSPSKQEYRFYGDVKGYKFVATTEEYDRIFRHSSNSCQPNAFNSSIFDQEIRQTRALNHVSSILHYWNTTDAIMVPINGTPLIENINTKKINLEAILQFYEKSSNIINKDLFMILKEQRVRWHPDKMNRLITNQNEKITKIFQIIDELWNKYKTL